MQDIYQSIMIVAIFNLVILVFLDIAAYVIAKAASIAYPTPESWDDEELSREVHRRIIESPSNL